MRRRPITRLVLPLVALAALPAFAANSVSVTQAAAREPTSTTVKGSFFINPQNLTVSTVPGAHYSDMITFLDSVTAGGKTWMIFHLNRGAGTDGWFFNVWRWKGATHRSRGDSLLQRRF